LVGVMQDVAEAHQRLHVTEARVQNNLSRINELKQEAAALLASQKKTQTTSSDTTAAVDMLIAQPAPTAGGPRRGGVHRVSSDER